MLHLVPPPLAFNLSGLYFIVSVEAWFATCLKIVDTLGQVLTLSCRAIIQVRQAHLSHALEDIIFANSTNLVCM